MAVQLALSVLLIALLIGDIFGVPFGYYKPSAPGSGSQEALQQPPAPAPGPVRSDVHKVSRLPQSPMQKPPAAQAQPAPADGSAGYMPEEPIGPQPQDMSPWKPDYQAGELYKFERSHDYGNSQRESNVRQLFLPPPIGVPGPVPGPIPGPFPGPIPIDPYPMAGPVDDGELAYAGPDRIMPLPLPLPPFHMDFPYDYNFLKGQYPEGTYSYQTRSFDDGSNYYNDIHYSNYPNRMWVRPFGLPYQDISLTVDLARRSITSQF